MEFDNLNFSLLAKTANSTLANTTIILHNDISLTYHCVHPNLTSPWVVYPLTIVNNILCYVSIYLCYISISRYYIKLTSILTSLKWCSILSTLFFTIANIAWLTNWHYDVFYCYWKYYISITVPYETRNIIHLVSREIGIFCQTYGYAFYALSCFIRLIYCFKDSIFEISKNLQIFGISVWIICVLMSTFSLFIDIFPNLQQIIYVPSLLLVSLTLIIYVISSFTIALIGMFRLHNFAKFIQSSSSPQNNAYTFKIKTVAVPTNVKNADENETCNTHDINSRTHTYSQRSQRSHRIYSDSNKSKDNNVNNNINKPIEKFKLASNLSHDHDNNVNNVNSIKNDKWNKTVRQLYKVMKRFTVLFSISLFSSFGLFFVVLLIFCLFFILGGRRGIVVVYVALYCYRTLSIVDSIINTVCLLLYNDITSNIYRKYCIWCDDNITKCWFYQCLKICDR